VPSSTVEFQPGILIRHEILRIKGTVFQRRYTVTFGISMNSSPQAIPIKVPASFRFYRRLFPMRSINFPPFCRQIRQGGVPACPLPIRIMGITGYQMPASAMEIEPCILAHTSLPTPNVLLRVVLFQ
jgi:hypothetical protein